MPLTVTVLAEPTFLVSKEALVKLAPSASLPRPLTARWAVALVVPSYSLSSAVAVTVTAEPTFLVSKEALVKLAPSASLPRPLTARWAVALVVPSYSLLSLHDALVISLAVMLALALAEVLAV